jgi:RimJ/RimL family protein N-acetyltransferase
MIEQHDSTSQEFLVRTSNCALRRLAESDLLHIVDYLNDPEVTRFMNVPTPMSIDHQRSWFLRKAESNLDHLFAILHKSTASDDAAFKFVGFSSLSVTDAAAGVAEGGTIIGDRTVWGAGIAREAKILQLDYAFSTLTLQRIYATICIAHERSRRLIESLGYSRERVIEKSICCDSVLYDQLVYVMTRRAWLDYARRAATR